MLEWLLEFDLFPLGEKMGRFLKIALDGSAKIKDYKTSVGELFLRQSKYAGRSQVAVYKFAENPSNVGCYLVVSTHGDSWTLTCAAGSPGDFKTMTTATRKLADSIVVTPDPEALLPQEHSLYELKMGGQRIGLREHALYLLADGETMQTVEFMAVGGVPNESFQVRSQFHLKSYQGERLAEGLVMQYVDGASRFELSYAEDPTQKTVQIKDLKREHAAPRVVNIETSLWNDDQIRACLRDALAGKNQECRTSSGVLGEKDELVFDVSTMKVKDKATRAFLRIQLQLAASNGSTISWTALARSSSSSLGTLSPICKENLA